MKEITEFKNIFKKNNWYYLKSKHKEHKDLISDHTLEQLVDQGSIIKMKAGLYRWIEIYSEGHEDLIDISMIEPRGVFCLYTAMYIYDLTSFVSSKYFFAIPRKRRTPQVLRIFHWKLKSGKTISSTWVLI